ncbi:hypothetical protein WJX84_005717 [Apatococcus fuscideae]|uniref:Hint domain-containing protein n=1 Tax=Apatococcus fuscideae TaxID=2026836 RepID=A0AAW1T8J5_9CHLO
MNGYHLCFYGPYSVKVVGSIATLNSTTNLTTDCPLATLSVYSTGNLANVKAHGSFPSGTLINATQASPTTIHINTFDGDKSHNCSAYYAVTSGSFLGASSSNTAASSTVSSGNGCFSGNGAAVVKTSSGSIVSRPMKELAIGDAVMVSQLSGKTAFEEVFMFTHQSKEVAASISLETASGSSLQVTPDHYVLVQPTGSNPSAEASILTASEVKLGDRLWTLPEGTIDGELQWSMVTAVSKTVQQGLYNPHTPSGTIVVDGVAACTFPDRIHASLEAHTLVTFPARILHRLLVTNTLRTAVNKVLLASYFPLHHVYNTFLAPGFAGIAALTSIQS